MTVTYDANGNRNNGSYATGTGNQITADGTWTYSYDGEGNMTKKSQGASAETWTYGYHQRNQLLWAEKRATDGGTLQMRADYKYDWNGNRIQKAVDSDGDTDIDTTERYTYDGWKTGPQKEFVGNENWDVWADLNGSSSLTTRYLRGDVIDQIFARTDAGSNEAYWLLTDRLGSLRNVVDDTQAVKDTLAYDGFGNVISESDAAFGGRYKWTGREVDVETGLQYNRARYYDGKIGRWISQDPLGFEAGDSNLYRYVANRPTSFIDPSGLDFIAVGNRYVRNWLGNIGAHHFSIAYFETTCDIRSNGQVTFDPLDRQDDDSLKTQSGHIIPVIQKGGIELIPKKWNADRFYRNWFGFGEVRIQTVSVYVSILRYWESADKYYPIFTGNPSEVKAKWSAFESLARSYGYAEQPDPGQEKTGNLFARFEDRRPHGGYTPPRYTGNFTKWPQSLYEAADYGNTSNTFITWIVREAGFPFPATSGWNPGGTLPNDPDPWGVFVATRKPHKPKADIPL